MFTMHFAEDQVNLAEDEIDIHYMLKKLQETYINWGLEKKTQKK